MKPLAHLGSAWALVCLAIVLWLICPAQAMAANQIAELRERYLETLHLLATEGFETATEALVDLELEVASQQGATGLDQLREVELAVASDLAASEPRLLLPLIALHELTHPRYWPEGLPANPSHARATVYRQIELCLEHLKTASDRRIASDLFVSLAGHFADGTAGPEANGLYTRALQYDPESPAALMGLALAREQSGRYRNALALLERLEEASTANPESRLRLAMNLDRLGKRGEAERILDDVISQPGPDWVSSLAYQQLARMRMEQERFDSAHDYLARGLSLFPDDQSLAVGLDYAEERLGLASGTPRVAELVGRSATVDSPSARYLYARPGFEHIEETRERLLEAAAENLPLLSRSLSTLPDGR